MPQDHPMDVEELVQPLDVEEAQLLIRQIITTGKVILVEHAKLPMRLRGMESGDILNVLRCGTPKLADQEGGIWRHEVCTDLMTVVIEFRSRSCLLVVNAWRNRRTGGKSATEGQPE